ncbi:MAG: NADH-quinone oxidoreductase subunit NuoF [Candidatus Hydrogenedentota bacterium]
MIERFKELKRKAEIEWENFNNSKQIRMLIGAATCGIASGALKVCDSFKKEIKTKKIQCEIYEVGCIGMCYAEPIVEICLPDKRRIMYGNVNEKILPQIIDDVILKNNPRIDLALCTTGEMKIPGIKQITELPMLNKQQRIVLRNAGIIDPVNINHYIARDGYSALLKAFTITPADVIKEVKDSMLRGRGGAGFHTGVKWEIARNTESDIKYIICNADEGDPGAFMDRAVLESDPHSVLEGMIIAAYAVGTRNGYIYVRAEYPLAVKRLKIAIEQAYNLGFLGRDIMGSGFDFEIEIKEGAGAFVCGEETALIASIEGRRGMPSSRPPFPAVCGLHKKPTVINNVETFANVPWIIQKGADTFAQLGTTKSKGTKVFALAGKVKHTGLIEVPMGITLKEVIYDIGGGIPNNKRLKAVQTGGPSGGCIPAELMDLKVDYEELTKAGSIMGSGGMIVLDEDTCIVDIARYFLEFTNNESCGKCIPCRIGSVHLLQYLTAITQGNASLSYIDKLEELSETIRLCSLCGLGQTLPNPVLSTIKYFRNEYEAHIKEKHCQALVCKDLIEYFIDIDKCTGCNLCFKICPVNAITGELKQVHSIDSKKCIRCGQCLDVCPTKVSAVKKGVCKN